MAQTPVSGFLGEIMQICRECPSITLTQAYVRAARMLCNKSRWLLRNLSLSTVANQQVYTLVPDAADEIIGIQAMSLATDTTSFNVMTETFSGGWDPNPSGMGSDTPGSYQYVPEGQFALYRMPTAVYSLVVTVAVQPKRDAVSVDSALVVSWDYALQCGALAYLLNLPRTPWTDKTEAQRQAMLFTGFTNQAASSAQRGWNAGARVTDRPGDGGAGIRTRMLPI